MNTNIGTTMNTDIETVPLVIGNTETDKENVETKSTATAISTTRHYYYHATDRSWRIVRFFVGAVVLLMVMIVMGFHRESLYHPALDDDTIKTNATSSSSSSSSSPSTSSSSSSSSIMEDFNFCQGTYFGELDNNHTELKYDIGYQCEGPVYDEFAKVRSV